MMMSFLEFFETFSPISVILEEMVVQGSLHDSNPNNALFGGKNPGNKHL